MQYAATRLLLNTVGRLSDGIRLGWRTGFDSGLMLEYIYENKPRGISPIGRLLDKQFISHDVWNGVRSRREFLIGQLNEAINHYDHPLLFDFAAGLGSYLFALPENRARIIAGDFEIEAVQAGKKKAERLNREDIHFQQANAFIKEELPTQHADILVSSGFFDILVEETEIHQVLKNGSAITKPGARWVFTIQEHHPDLRLLKETMIDLHKKSWDLVPRSAEQLAKWAEDFGWRLEAVERNNYFAVGTLVKEK